MGAVLNGLALVTTGFIVVAALVRVGDQTPAPIASGPPVPPFAVQPSPQRHTMTFHADRYGQFWIPGKANGVSFTFLIDTGASDVVFSTRDARQMGIDLAQVKFDRTVSTANGLTHAAVIRLPRLEIGSFVVTDFPVTINEGDLDEPLLGMALLRRLDVAVSNGTLTLSH